MKLGVVIALLIVVVWSALALIQLWLEWFEAATFFKLTVTAGVLLAVTLLVSLAVREYLSEKRLKDEGYLDD